MPPLSPVEQQIFDLCRKGPQRYKQLCQDIRASDGEVARSLSRLESLGHLTRRHAWWCSNGDNQPRTTSRRAKSRGTRVRGTMRRRRTSLAGVATNGGSSQGEKPTGSPSELGEITETLPVAVVSVLRLLRGRQAKIRTAIDALQALGTL